ncbi:MAG: 16S rRNA (adenine(1518)-N(6)/adenine(1519)-N(6))-dimethyltransferase RsmA [candidate division KSB1 bacterium]|nr:16S rRNA (adenine(1518)-N(6)/adenine(1519)-N(6))-dimethyltransferase RsmA [candidate division KSB1 bacterium]
MTVELKAKQSLGQNFLTDANVADNIVSAMQLNSTDTVIEIGPGRGMLTRRICPLVHECIALEIDQRLIPGLQRDLADAKNLTILHQDALKYDFSVKGKDGLVVVGNIPYNITSPIFFKALDNRHCISRLIMLIQREVAERFVSAPNSKEYGILAVLSQTFADVELLLRVPPTVFKPRPKVDSALVRWTFTQKYETQLKDPELYRTIVKQAFGQRRKMMRRSLKDRVNDTRNDFDLTRRPEDLSIQEWIDLTNELMQHQNQER